MPTVIDQEWLLSRATAIKAQIVALDNAILALTVGGVQSYSLNTGQTTQSVTRADLSSLRTAVASLENQLSTLDVRINGATTRMLPDW